MAILVQPDTHRELLLASRTVIGRAPSCALVLSVRRVSGEHAVIFWDQGRWRLRDLGSRNGTFLNSQRLEANEVATLDPGASLVFGGAPPWVLRDTAPPIPHARNLNDGRTVQAPNGMMLLPDEQAPTFTVYSDPAAGWMAEGDQEPFPVYDSTMLTVDGEPWRLSLPAVIDTTLAASSAPLQLLDLTLRFTVSWDEETVALVLCHPDGEIDLGERAHMYLLLTLARQRLADAERGLPPAEQGWVYVEDTVRGLRLSPHAMRMHIYRARLQFNEAGILGAAELFERRRSSKQLRLAIPRAEITRP